MSLESLFRAGVLINSLLLIPCLGILIVGLRIWRNPVAFWDQFNPFLQPYSRFVLVLGRVIGSLWAFGGLIGCILFTGNAIQAGLYRRW